MKTRADLTIHKSWSRFNHPQRLKQHQQSITITNCNDPTSLTIFKARAEDNDQQKQRSVMHIEGKIKK